MQADCVSYCALLNAYGWSNVKGKAEKCYYILQKMLSLYRSRENPWAKPDIIACNTVLNACSFDTPETHEERKQIIEIVVDVLETFQSVAPRYGWPNHLTYCYTLQSIKKHVLDPEQRAKMAESTFLQCCRSGHVSVLVVVNLQDTMEWPRFSRLLGDALTSKEGEDLFFQFKKLPENWTRFAPNPKQHRISRPGSKKRFGKKPSMARIMPS